MPSRLRVVLGAGDAGIDFREDLVALAVDLEECEEHGDHRDGEEGPRHPEQRGTQEDGTEGHGRVDVDRLGADLRFDGQVLDLLVDQPPDQCDHAEGGVGAGWGWGGVGGVGFLGVNFRFN